MICTRQGGVVLAVLVAASGCAMQEEVVTTPQDISWTKLGAKARANAKPAPAPALLPMTYFSAGRLFEHRGQLAQAAQQYRRAVAHNDQFVQAYNRLGIVLNRLGQHDQADKAFMAAIELQPAAAYLRNNLGFSYLLQGRWQDAEAELRNALQLRPDFARARMNLAVVLARQGRFAEALQQMSRAVSAARAYYNLALLYRAAGRYADARRALEQAVALEPGLKIARAQLERLKGLAAADIRQPGAPAQQLARTEQAMHRLDRALPQAQPGPADRPSGSPELAATTQPASGKLRRASLSALYRCVRQMLRPERWAAVWHWARSVDGRRMLAWIDPQARWLAPILVYARLEPHAGKLVWEQVLPEGG